MFLCIFLTYCLMHEMLFIRDLKPNPNVQSDSIRAKSTFIIFAPIMLVWRAKIALNAVIQFALSVIIFLDNSVMTTPKRRILQ